MRPEERDAARLWDMLDFARAVTAVIQGRTQSDYERDRALRLATERALEILGEAARQVSEEFKAAHPEIPWRRLIGFRNILAHDYGEILNEKVWDVATRSVQELIPVLEAIAPSSRPGEER